MISKRSEIIFLYDTKNCNPNGDPLDANRPRIDEETGKCLVTDVRLKRTIRDYLFEKGYNGENGKDIFIRDDNDGNPVTGAERSASYANKEEFIKKFIDVRLFGGVSAVKNKANKRKTKEDDDTEIEDELDTNKTFNLTGPVQFGMGKSFNKVKENFIKGTGAFATKEGALQKTFREEYNISYGLIGFHGVVNEFAAKHTKTTEEDILELLDAMWSGTKNLLTRSKKGHMPRLLVKINYKKSGFFIGDLLERISLVIKDGKTEESLEDIEDLILDSSKLNELLKKHEDEIDSITVMKDERLSLTEEIIMK